jgi:hypothetical protein
MMDESSITIFCSITNVMKSRDEVMATLPCDPKIQEYGILAFQELWRNPFISTTHNPTWEISAQRNRTKKFSSSGLKR